MSAVDSIQPHGQGKGSLMDPLGRLVAIEEIKQVKVRYARLVDSKRWESLADVFI
jgi:hypothetical protein